MKTEEEQKISDTPETDAVCSVDSRILFSMVDADFARKLERERDEANKELHKKYIEFDKLFDEAERIKIERDKALEELVGFKNYTT